MPTRKAGATWKGGLSSGNGSFSGESGATTGAYSVGSRFADESGSNPEELLAAAHAACYSMALTAQLEDAGFSPKEVHTDAACTVEKDGDGFTITKMELTSRADVDDIAPDRFAEIAEATKNGCPVSKALSGVNIELDASLK